MSADAAPPASMSWLSAMIARDGRATAYVCQNFTCGLPVTDPRDLERQIDDAGAARRIII